MIKLIILLSGDGALVFTALYGTGFAGSGELPPGEGADTGILWLALFLLVPLFASYLLELYNRERKMSRGEHVVRASLALAVTFCILLLSARVFLPVMIDKEVLSTALVLFGCLQFLWHTAYRGLMSSPRLARKVLVLGTGPLASKMGELITTAGNRHVLQGYVPLPSEPVHVPSHAIVGKGDGIAETVTKERAQKLVISLTERRESFPVRDVLTLKFRGVEVVDAPSFYEEMTGKLLIENITPSWFIFSSGFRMTTAMRVYKRAFDLFFSGVGLLIALPLFPLIALAIKIDSRGPVFFRQARVGERERVFMICKLRTMHQDAENGTGAVWAQVNDPRVTRVGRFLRKTRLDELPQLYNTLVGDMSFIGPRPERPVFVEQLKKIIPFYSERHFVKPGITGWAQIRYSYGASVEDAIEKLRYDLYYIKNLSLWIDLVIILETVKVILFGRGAR
ncbi:MAG: TIGR03013 family PEP-CTERM/XrtA system glycosyltransferase [Alphaproteobacteria bacterium]|uniref:TIGR03013 family PEP-CTERM/XrtA system glycosyltransferase n=1 Tax=Candidatus Nitrobium versatile TaxID=2884831 RepID=A0A953JA68_9BACT|nr:TIGR03013 family PEP-CTERM/XrtA system glycosyltransferase [Candidatus Nitrobium versatile]